MSHLGAAEVEALPADWATSSRVFGNRSREQEAARYAFEATESVASDKSVHRFFENLRATQYRRLDVSGQVYLDYVGSSLHAESQLDAHAELLNRQVYGNPHSASPTSMQATQREEECRARILRHFNADPKDYEVVYTLNASQAVKLVGESFPFTWRGRLLYTADSHNCVVGLRRYAAAGRSKVVCAPMSLPDLRVDQAFLAPELAKGGRAPKLFALTGQSNTTGVKHPLSLVRDAQRQGWTVLLDAAALAPTNRIDLTEYPADFVALSFYKMFGYPTGLGCLIARKSALERLDRPWFSGGTVRLVSAFFKNIHFMTDNASGSHFQDGTIPFGTLPAVGVGLDHLEAVDMKALEFRVTSLTDWLLGRLAALKHENGEPLVRCYGPQTTESRGGTIAMNLYDRNGRWIPHHLVERFAAQHRISVRTGCFCNPGIAEQALGYSKHSDTPPAKLGAAYMWMAHRIGVDRLLSGLSPFERPFGMVRASVGIASSFDDVWRFVQFLRSFLDAALVEELTAAYEADFTPPSTLC